jgi:hypothetical protein
MAAGSSQHTLSVKNKIEKTKEKALLGGGQKRINNIKRFDKCIN